MEFGVLKGFYKLDSKKYVECRIKECRMCRMIMQNDVECRMMQNDVECRMQNDVECRMQNVECRMQNVECRNESFLMN